jgi:hypothetical protein
MTDRGAEGDFGVEEIGNEYSGDPGCHAAADQRGLTLSEIETVDQQAHHSDIDTKSREADREKAGKLTMHARIGIRRD